MAIIKRKSLVDSVKKDLSQKKSRKEALSDQVIEKLSGEKVETEVEKEAHSKLTVMIPVRLHDKLKFKALEKKSKIRKLIIDYIEGL